MPQILSATTSNQYMKFKLGNNMTFRLDSEGLWCSFREGDRFYRRTLSNAVVINNKQICKHEAYKLHSKIHKQLTLLHNDLISKPLDAQNQIDDQTLLERYLEKGTRWDAHQILLNSRLYSSAYKEPVTILPPDRYYNLVVQPATGCPNNQCSFCAFYRGKPFQPQSLSEFNRHLNLLKLLLGSAIEGRDGIFLGSANALALPQKKIIPMLEALNNSIGHKKRGISTFFDPEHAPNRTDIQWQELATQDIKQVVIGLETGLPNLRRSFGKSGNLSHIKKAVDNIKQAGIRIGLTILLGMENEKTDTDHRKATINFISQLKLDKNDLIYLSPLQNTKSPNIDKQTKIFRLGFQEYSTAKTPLYSMDKFNYYT